MELFGAFLYIIITLFISCLLFLGYLSFIENQVNAEPNQTKKSRLHYLFNTIVFPELGFLTLFQDSTNEHLAKCKVSIFVMIFQMYLITNVIYHLPLEVNWTALFYLSMGSILLFAITRRIWAVSQMIKLLKIHEDAVELFEQQEQWNQKFLEFEKSKNKLEKIVAKETKKWESEKDSYLRLNSLVDSLRNKIKEHQDISQYKCEVVAHNLRMLEELPEDAEIAVDSNILMKCDPYLVHAFQKKPIVISKRVQQEWDKNKYHSDTEKSFRAREAIRRLLQLENYRFIVTRWDNRFLENHNLQKGVPDDEIIADYLYEQEKGKKIVVISNDNNFLGSAKVHLPLLNLRDIDLFSSQ